MGSLYLQLTFVVNLVSIKKKKSSLSSAAPNPDMAEVWLKLAVTSSSSKELGDVWKERKGSSLRIGIPVAPTQGWLHVRATCGVGQCHVLRRPCTWLNASLSTS